MSMAISMYGTAPAGTMWGLLKVLRDRRVRKELRETPDHKVILALKEA